ncbi:MAG TPA: DUF5615 family PIN-like protein [Methylophilaceae bacterium]|nr:DUF5615 family PIN-like protein [Methylophilaceae bacterium]
MRENEMKFLCDEMFKGLARKLRTAGYDVEMEPDGTQDRQLIRRAMEEGRVLLTRDVTLLEIRHAKQVVVLLESDGLEACAREVTNKLGINWLLNPFSRCSLCNTPLVETERPDDFPPDVEAAFICSTCEKYYWQGGHVDRMRKRLEKWQAEFHSGRTISELQDSSV